MLKTVIQFLTTFFVEFLRFAFWTCVIGFASFLFGQSLPRERFDYNAFPFKEYAFEKNGTVYRHLRIHKWKDIVPDMSKIIGNTFRKAILKNVRHDCAYFETFIRETCVAETVHLLLIAVSSVFYFTMGQGLLGTVSMAAFALGNVPFVMIQRYNRPRLVALYQKQMLLLEKGRKKCETPEVAVR